MNHRRSARRKNFRILLVALSCLLVAVAANFVSTVYRMSFGGGLLFVLTVGVLILCVVGGLRGKRAVEDEK